MAISVDRRSRGTGIDRSGNWDKRINKRTNSRALGVVVPPKTTKVDDDDLTSYIYDTISRLERLANRLEALANEGSEDGSAPASDTPQRGRSSA